LVEVGAEVEMREGVREMVDTLVEKDSNGKFGESVRELIEVSSKVCAKGDVRKFGG
jgi:hypothetical protein